jgi:general secretion pathway protein D
MLDQVDTWVQRLDHIGPEGDNFYVYRVENGKAKELAKILNSTFGGSRGIVRGPEEAEIAPNATVSRIAGDGPADRGAPPPPPQAPPPDQGAPDLNGNGSLDMNGGGSSRAGDVRIIADEANNKLLIKASGRDYQRILSILRRIDQPPLQVMINATLAEVTLNDSLKYGVQFYLQKGHNGKDGLLNFTTGPQIDIGPSAPGLNFVIGSLASNPKVILDALATETAVRVVSSPSVVVLHNQTATLQVGDEVPIATRSVVSVIDAQAPIVNEIQFRNTGVILKVTPRVNLNGLVTMEIEQEISAVTSQTSVGETGTLTPTISQRRIKSTIAVQSGQMVVLGGLISELMNNEKSRVPVIGKIPYLGDVIGDTQRGKERRELIVFLRPGVIRNPRDASNLAQEMRARMESLAPRPAPWDIEVHPQPIAGAPPKPFK